MKGRQAIDLTSRRFGRLVVLFRDGSKGSHAAWACRCDCGTELTVSGVHLRRGTQSCGCYAREQASRRNQASPPRLRHGGCVGGDGRTYRSWLAMRVRCRRESSISYPNYGGRGINYCEHWESFDNFFADMGERPPGTSLDRIDSNRGYEPGNCRWATRTEQSRGKRNNIRVTHQGCEVLLIDLCESLGASYGRTYRRIKDGWSLDRALSEPARSGARFAKLDNAVR